MFCIGSSKFCIVAYLTAYQDRKGEFAYEQERTNNSTCLHAKKRTGVFTRTYEVMPPREEVKGSYHFKMTRMQTEKLGKMKVSQMRILDSFSLLYEFE